MSSKQDDPTPEHLFARFVEQHDLEALGQLFDQLAPGLLQVAGRLGRDEHDAADALQETFLALVERRGHFDPDRPLVPWIVGILINKSRGLARPRELRDADAHSSDRHPSTSESDRPEERLARFELGHALDAALADLPDNQRSAVASRLFDGTPGPAVASAEGITQGALRVRLHRGRELLQRALAPVAATWFGAALLGWLGLPTTRSTLVQAKRLILRRAAPAATATRLAPKLLAATVLTAAAVTIALVLNSEPPRLQANRPPTQLTRVQTQPAPPHSKSTPTTSTRAPAAASATPTQAVLELTARALFLGTEEPVEGLPITLQSSASGSKAAFTAITKSNGRATFHVPLGTLVGNLNAKPTETTIAAREVFALPASELEGTELTLHVGRGASLKGVVLGPDNLPTPFATVDTWFDAIFFIEGPPDRTVQCDANGEFQVDHIGLDFAMTARAEGLACKLGLHGRLREGSMATGGVLELDQAVLRSGTVVDARGLPIEDARVRFTSGLASTASSDITDIEGVLRFEAGAGEVLSDASGRFAIAGLPRASMSFTVSKHGFRKTVACYPWEPEATLAPLTVQLESATQLAGTVVDPSGRPVPNAQVRAHPDGHGPAQDWQATTDTQGRFVLTSPELRQSPGQPTIQPTLLIRADEFDLGLVVVRDPGAADLVVRLEPERPLEGTLRWASGKPAADLDLWIESERLLPRLSSGGPPATWEGQAGSWRTRTDAAGRFAFHHLGPGPLRLHIAHPTESCSEVVEPLTADQETVELVLDRARFERVQVRGRVLDLLSRTPIPGAKIFVNWLDPDAERLGLALGSRSRSTEVAVTDANGNYSFFGVPPGEARVHASKQGLTTPPVEARRLVEGEQTWDLYLSPARTLQLAFRDRQAVPLSPYAISAKTLEGDVLMLGLGPSTAVDSLSCQKSDLSIFGLPAAPVVLTVRHEHGIQSFPIDLTAPLTEPLVLTLTSPAERELAATPK